MTRSTLDPVTPTAEDIEFAKAAKQAIDRQESFVICTDAGRTSLEVPGSVFRLVRKILEVMSHGDAVSITPFHLEMTTQQAANFLNVSRPFVVKLIDTGQLPASKVGTHRRIKLVDLVEFRRQNDRAHNRAMDTLAEESQRLGIGYCK